MQHTYHQRIVAPFWTGFFFVDCDETGGLSGTTQNVLKDGAVGGEKSSSICLLCGGGGQEEEVTRGGLDLKQTENTGMEGVSVWMLCYCAGRTGWTGSDQLKLFNPPFHPEQVQTNFSGNAHIYSPDVFLFCCVKQVTWLTPLQLMS